jgi:hypothetical protein
MGGMIKEIHIYDMDGTIVDSSHRYRTIHNGEKVTIDLPHWRANEKNYFNDSLLPLAEQYKKHIADPSVYVIIVTARTVAHVEQSAQWIKDNLGWPDVMRCRPNGSNESGAVLKVNQLKQILNLKQFAKLKRFFYEDNSSYLNAVSAAVGAVPVFVQSRQGH